MVEQINYWLLLLTLIFSFILKDFYDIIIRNHIVTLLKNYYNAYIHVKNKTLELSKVLEKIDNKKEENKNGKNKTTHKKT